MSWKKANSPGWASFDPKKQQQKDNSAFFESFDHLKKEKESFPPISNNATAQNKKNNLIPPVRSFSSVLLPPANLEFPALPDDNNNNNNLNTQKSSAVIGSSRSTTESDNLHTCRKLKELFSWADESLIADVLAAVDNDINKASILLVEMVCSDSTVQKNEKDVQASEFNVNKGTLLEEFADDEDLNCIRKCNLNYANEKLSYEYSSRDVDSDKASAQNNPFLVHWKNVPAEPEWEEDDIYYIHREKALHMMRSASHHSRKASDAYMRGDHFSAQQLSAKAKEEWRAAERLNAEAAKKILNIRNNENGLWKLDLHGLHASEAVKALQERLQELEPMAPSYRSLSPNKRNNNNDKISGGVGRCSSLESLTCGKRWGSVSLDGKICESSSLEEPRRTSLHVITGIGNHSRGEAALPTAVRNFLNENNYHYDESRPGLITVRPKFRHKRILDTKAS